MTLSEYVAALKRGWVIVLIACVVSVACAGLLQLRKSPVYSSTTALFVASAVGDQNPEELSERNKILTERVASYVALVGGNVVADRVKQELGDSSIDPQVTVTSPAGTVVLRITATADNAQEAADVARAYAKVVPSVIKEVENVGDANAEVKVTTIQTAKVPKSSDASSVVPSLVAAGILGLGIGFVIVVARETLRRERAEAAAGAPAEKAVVD